MRWALSLAMLLLMFAGGLTLERRHKTAPAVSAGMSDDQLFSDLSAMEQSNEPKAIQPIHGCSRNKACDALLAIGAAVSRRASGRRCRAESTPGGAGRKSRAISTCRPRSANRSAPPCSSTGRICMNVRAAVNQAEQALAEQFNRNPVDPGKTNEAIERLVDARSDLTRTLTQLSLKLRLVLTEQQWQELQRRRPGQGDDSAPPGAIRNSPPQ